MTADVEAALVAALPPLVGVDVVTQVPRERPAEFVVVVASGGPEVADLVLDEATVAWEAWAATSVRAAELAGLVRDAFPALVGISVGGVLVTDAGSTRPRWFPDATSGVARYVGTGRVLFHAA